MQMKGNTHFSFTRLEPSATTVKTLEHHSKQIRCQSMPLAGGAPDIDLEKSQMLTLGRSVSFELLLPRLFRTCKNLQLERSEANLDLPGETDVV